jgi:hypothetical protein
VVIAPHPEKPDEPIYYKEGKFKVLIAPHPEKPNGPTFFKAIKSTSMIYLH